MLSAASLPALPMLSTSREGTPAMNARIASETLPVCCAIFSSSDCVYMSRNSWISLAPTRCQLPLSTSRAQASFICA